MQAWSACPVSLLTQAGGKYSPVIFSIFRAPVTELDTVFCCHTSL